VKLIHFNDSSYTTSMDVCVCGGVGAASCVCSITSNSYTSSHAKEPYKRDYILQKRPTILRSLLLTSNSYTSSKRVAASCNLMSSYIVVHQQVRWRDLFISMTPSHATSMNIRHPLMLYPLEPFPLQMLYMCVYAYIYISSPDAVSPFRPFLEYINRCHIFLCRGKAFHIGLYPLIQWIQGGVKS